MRPAYDATDCRVAILLPVRVARARVVEHVARQLAGLMPPGTTFASTVNGSGGLPFPWLATNELRDRCPHDSEPPL